MQATEIRRSALTEPLPTLTKLQQALIATGVKILDSGDVDKYKREKIIEVRETLRALDAAKPSGFFGWLKELIFPSEEITLSSVRGFTERKRDLIDWHTIRAGWMDRGELALYDSVRSQGTDHDTTIPGEVNDICAKLASADAHASLEVEQLDADPFMVAVDLESLSQARYYIAVWDEAGFIG